VVKLTHARDATQLMMMKDQACGVPVAAEAQREAAVRHDDGV